MNELAKKDKERSKGATYWKEIEFKGFIPERTGDSMRNHLKVQLKFGLIDYYKEHVTVNKYAHAFAQILTAKLPKETTLTTQEKNYLRTAIWNEYQLEHASSSGGKKSAKSNSTMMTNILQGNHGATSQIDTLVKNNAAKPGSNVVTYDLRDIGGKGHHQ